MSEKEASFDTSNSIGQNFVPSNSVNSSLSKQIPKSNSHETQVSHYNEETIHKVKIKDKKFKKFYLFLNKKK